MPIDYILTERCPPNQPAATRKVFAQASSRGETTPRRLAERIAQMSSLSPIDVMGMLEALFQVVPQELAEGRIVRLGDFGSFQVTLQGQGAASAQDFSPALVTGRRVRFREGRGVARVIKAAELRRTTPATTVRQPGGSEAEAREQ